MKYYGNVGYRVTEEIRPGIWSPEPYVKRPYYGDILQATRRFSSSDKVNDDVTVENRISIVSDPFALENFHNIVFVQWMGTNWKVSNVEVQFPRLILSIGGAFNADDESESDDTDS